MKRILILEPYYGGSHKYFLDGLQKHVRANYHLLALPARNWKMRMQLSALWFVEQKTLSTPTGGSRSNDGSFRLAEPAAGVLGMAVSAPEMTDYFFILLAKSSILWMGMRALAAISGETRISFRPVSSTSARFCKEFMPIQGQLAQL